MNRLDFDYVQARSVQEAVNHFTSSAHQGITPLYYGGGTEILTLGRLHELAVDQVIDIKAIAQTREIRLRGEKLCLGSALTLTEITDDPLVAREFPLLPAIARGIADRTARNKITLGGNMCGSIIYREVVLALLLCDSQLLIAGPDGIREVHIGHVFQRTMNLRPGEFIVQIVTDPFARKAPFFHIKRRKMGSVGYPVVTAAAVHVNDRIRTAFSGVCAFPFRSSVVEEELNRSGVERSQRVENALRRFAAGAILDDLEASREFRLFVLKNILADILRELGG